MQSVEARVLVEENAVSGYVVAAKREVDRNWLSKLLARHAHNHPSMPEDLEGKALVVAPMVDASDLPYRLLCRRYNTNLCFTPMIHARMFMEKQGYRRKFWRDAGMPSHDRPLIAQFCGGDRELLLGAMKVIQSDVDGIDLNCGCPQSIAKRGRYGAFLLEEEDYLVELVRYLASNLDVPFSVKVRILPTGIEDSLKLYRRLVDAGAWMLTIHGRTRHQKKDMTGEVDWEAIRRVVELLGPEIPILANGGISSLDDARQCLKFTGADGAMSSEGVLEYPPLFTETNVASTDYRRTGPGRAQIARDYLDLCTDYPPDEGGQSSGMKCIRAHLHRFLHADLHTHTHVRDAVVRVSSMELAYESIRMIDEIHKRDDHDITSEQLSWYVRHRAKEGEEEEKKQSSEDSDDGEQCCVVEEDQSEYIAAQMANVFASEGCEDCDY